jgi:hypothetical protein
MKYRVEFKLQNGGIYFTEWFETLNEAALFVTEADLYGRVTPRLIENEDGEAF